MDKMKIFKQLMGPSSKTPSASTENGLDCPSGSNSTNSTSNKSASATRLDDPEVRHEEKLRQKSFAHYDCQSMTASIRSASNLCHALAKRRNTTTGASAASMLARNPSLEGQDEGDGRSNDLVQSCPYFRNELGGEGERVISLSRSTIDRPVHNVNRGFLHRPNMSCGLSLLEGANERRWRLKSCPYQKLTNEKSFIIENFDIGATYYRERFYGLEHQNWFGIDDSLGPIAISIRKERIAVSQLSSESPSPSTPSTVVPTSSTSENQSNQFKYQYRLIIRTSEISVLRGTVFEDCVPGLSSTSSRHNHHLNHHAKEVLEYVCPEITLSCLKMGLQNADEQLLKLDEQMLNRTYKVGVLLCKNGQSTEEEMYNNEHSTPAFDEFLSVLGEKIRLQGFSKYRGGLDNKNDTTGTHAIYTTYNENEILFHVSTLLPFTPNNKQQLPRKRHIGNDIVTIVFQEPFAASFSPKTMRSQFQHVFIVVRQLPQPPSYQGPTKYAVAVTRSKDVPVFGPPIHEGGVYAKSKGFTEFLLSKMINAENAAHRSEKFRSMTQRTRHEYLKDLAQNYVSNATINDVSIGTSAGAKLVSTFFGATKKSRSIRSSQFIGKAVIRGAITWELAVEDYQSSKLCDCLLGISSDTFILLEEPTKEVIFVIPNTSILGWNSHPSYIRIFYHQGECVLLRCKDADLDEIGEIVSRLRAVTSGCETQEMILKRNSSGQLGFHVNHEGIVTEVDQSSFAWSVGLRPNYRIVEICKIAIATLDLEQVSDILKTSSTVSVTVLPPSLPSGSPKRGCNLTNCSYLSTLTNGSGGEYENISGILERTPFFSGKGGRGKKHTPNKPLTAHSSRPVMSARSTPASPDQLVMTQRYVDYSSFRANNLHPPHIRKVTTLKASPTSAFSTLSPAISLSEVSQEQISPRDPRFAYSRPADYYAYSRQYGTTFGTLVKTRSEMSLTNPSPPPTHFSVYAPSSTGRRFPSPSRSHSQHFPSRPTSLMVNQQGYSPSAPPPKPKHSVNPSGYFSDTSPPADVWSNSSTTRSAPAETSLERRDSRSGYPQRPLLTRSPKIYTNGGVRSIPDRMRTKGSVRNGNNVGYKSTVQEDLLKLLNPDFVPDHQHDNVHEVSSNSGADTTSISTTQFSTPYSSLERPIPIKANGLGDTPEDLKSKTGHDVVISAKPAHVVSMPTSPLDYNSTNAPVPKPPRSSTLPSIENSMSSHTRYPLNSRDHDHDMDWPSLVNTATKAIASNKDVETMSAATTNSWTNHELGSTTSSSKSSTGCGDVAPESLKQLEETVEKLQSDLVREQTTNACLEEEVNKLKEENQRLQAESATTAAQLKKFTEWFFHNINAK